MPNCDRYFLLDREYHLFDIAYLHSRFESFWPDEIPTKTSNHRGPKQDTGEGMVRPIPPTSMGEAPATADEREDMYETLADA